MEKENLLPVTTELMRDPRGRWLLLPACRGIPWQSGTAPHAAWPRESLGLGSPWHCQLDQKAPSSQSFAPLPAWLVAGVPSGCWMSQCLSSRTAVILLLYTQKSCSVQPSPLTFRLRSALLLLDFHIGQAPLNRFLSTQPSHPHRYSKPPQSYLKGEKKGPVR